MSQYHLSFLAFSSRLLILQASFIKGKFPDFKAKYPQQLFSLRHLTASANCAFFFCTLLWFISSPVLLEFQGKSVCPNCILSVISLVRYHLYQHCAWPINRLYISLLVRFRNFPTTAYTTSLQQSAFLSWLTADCGKVFWHCYYTEADWVLLSSSWYDVLLRIFLSYSSTGDLFPTRFLS